MADLNGILDITLIASTLRLVTPILLAALGGLFTARAGIFNIALEGMMLVAAFFAVAGLFWTHSPEVGLFLAVGSSLLMALIFGFFVIDMKGDAIVIGLAINILALGLTTYSMRLVFGVQGVYYDPTLRGLPDVQLPVIGDSPTIKEMLSGFSILVYLSLAAVIAAQVLLFRHPIGLRIRAVGEDPVAAASVGISVRGMRYLASGICGVMCGLAGAELSISLVTQFVQGMTAGRGFIALVAVMFGRAHPVGVLAASLLFGFTYALTLRLQGIGIPPQFVSMLPYLATIGALILVQLQQMRRQRRKARSAVEEAPTEIAALST